MKKKSKPNPKVHPISPSNSCTDGIKVETFIGSNDSSIPSLQYSSTSQQQSSHNMGAISESAISNKDHKTSTDGSPPESSRTQTVLSKKQNQDIFGSVQTFLNTVIYIYACISTIFFTFIHKSEFLPPIGILILAAMISAVMLLKRRHKNTEEEEAWKDVETRRNPTQSRYRQADESDGFRRNFLQRSTHQADNLSFRGVLSPGFCVSSIIEQLWSQINVAISATIKDMLEPMFEDMLPGPLKSLHFTKLDLGHVPIKLENIKTHPAQKDSVQVDVDVVWDGTCDIDLRANIHRGAALTLGVESIKLQGRMTLLLSPLTNQLPVVSAVQYAFTNPPELELTYTGWAQVADFSMLKGTIRNIVNTSLKSMMVLPNRMLYKLDLANDFLDTYQPPVGMVRVTAVNGRGFKVLHKLLRDDVPDIYCRIRVGASKCWKTSTQNNNCNPEWNESADFLLSDHEQVIYLDVFDEDLSAVETDGTKLGSAQITVLELLTRNGTSEVELNLNGKDTAYFVTLRCDIHQLTPQIDSFTRQEEYGGKHSLCGHLTILVTRAFDIPLKKEDAETFVQVSYGKQKFLTHAVSDYPGVDALNPTYDCAFHVLLTTNMMASSTTTDKNIVFALMNRKTVLGTTTVTYNSLISSSQNTITDRRNIGTLGAKLAFRVSLCGLQPEKSAQTTKTTPSQEQFAKHASTTTDHHLDSICLTVVRGRGFQIENNFFGEDDVPDIYCNVNVKSMPNDTWSTSTIMDDTMPHWNESHTFLISDSTDIIRIDAFDAKKARTHVHVGSAEVKIGKLLRAERPMEVELQLENKERTGAFVTLKCIQLAQISHSNGDDNASVASSSVMTNSSRRSKSFKKRLKKLIRPVSFG